MPQQIFAGLELLATAVMLFDEGLRVSYVNPAAESLFEVSRRNVFGDLPQEVFVEPVRLQQALRQALADEAARIEHDILLELPNRTRLHVNCGITTVVAPGVRLLVEFHPIDQQLRIAREERMLDQSQANRMLIRNLAHEIKNPLGGIRGAAQLLDRELDQPALKEYTQVIIHEATRLQTLMDRLLAPHRLPHVTDLNIHEVLERVRSVIHAENQELAIRRDYDPSLPDISGDREQLIQAMLNIVRNAAQAVKGRGEIVLRTRAARQVTLARKRHRLALMVQVIDNGPGIPDALRDRIFDPLVSGREGGHGLGLTIAQNFVNQHRGTIECESEPGRTCFSVLLPVKGGENGHQ